MEDATVKAMYAYVLYKLVTLATVDTMEGFCQYQTQKHFCQQNKREKR